jgi:hypothetical protein
MSLIVYEQRLPYAVAATVITEEHDENIIRFGCYCAVCQRGDRQ